MVEFTMRFEFVCGKSPMNLLVLPKEAKFNVILINLTKVRVVILFLRKF
jgi:hypothetical protein